MACLDARWEFNQDAGRIQEQTQI